MFLPTTPRELAELGWDGLDVILVTGDAYLDSPLVGVALIGKVLTDAGYRVGIIAQPALDSTRDITRLGEPRLFWGVSAGCIDSLVANYTPSGKPRRQDDYTPGGQGGRRPDRATIAYTNLIRRAFRPTRPVVLGGLEASLRRLAHFDFPSQRVRRSVLLDAKADILVYGMGERTVLELAQRLRSGDDLSDVRGTCRLEKAPVEGYLELPSFEEVSRDPQAFSVMFASFAHNSDPLSARGLCQRHGERYVIQNPPAAYLTTPELDAVYGLDFEREVHPFCAREGAVRAMETIRFSLPTHRGCFGGCSFCAIAVHEGRRVRSRSQASILEEAATLTRHRAFKGYILDVGGPTANMYGMHCPRMERQGACDEQGCLYPQVCPNLVADHAPLTELLERLRGLPGVKKAFVASGLRHDLVLHDTAHGMTYLDEVVRHHVSGQLKLAPEHSVPAVLRLMGKPDINTLLAFKQAFERLSRQAGKDQYLTYYFMAAHPGCEESDMQTLRDFTTRHLGLTPRQVQIFTPTPSTWSTLMYHTGRNPFTGGEIPVERRVAGREQQKRILTTKADPWTKKRARHR